MIIFLRHGQAINNVDHVLAGRTPGIPLTEAGVEQVHGIARFLQPFEISAIYSSPIERAAKTAEIVAEHCSLDFQFDERLIELEMGKLTGMHYEEISDEYGNVFSKFFDNKAEVADLGVETFKGVKERVTSMVDFVVEEHPAQNVLLVTHAEPIKAMIATILKANAAAVYELVIHYASLTVFRERQGGISLSAINLMEPERAAMIR